LFLKAKWVCWTTIYVKQMKIMGSNVSAIGSSFLRSRSSQILFSGSEPWTLLLDALHDGLTVYDHLGCLLWVNEKGCEILGYPRDELVGRNISEIATLPTVAEIVSEEFDRCSFDTVRANHRGIDDYRTPGFMVFKNGKRLLYSPREVSLPGLERPCVAYTLHEVLDLNGAQAKISELQKLTNFYQAQVMGLKQQALGEHFAFTSASMHSLIERSMRIAQLDGNVLITGETGVGKNLLAKYLHVGSRRSEAPFIHVNCACLPESLIEAELFGYAEGAFTGAVRKGRRGLIEQANGGIVFLDEISEMPLSMQAKLLTTIEDKSIRRLGDERWRPLDVRFIAATNRDRSALSDGTKVRQDLFYRLSTNCLHIPPLRERPTDIPCLVDHMLGEFNSKNGRQLRLSAEVYDKLCTAPLPGNARELRSIVWEIGAEITDDDVAATLDRIPTGVETAIAAERPDDPRPVCLQSDTSPRRDSTEERLLRELTDRHNGDVRAIAKSLGVHRTTAIRKLKRYDIPYPRYAQSQNGE